jgi:hypothetical protein
MFNSRIEIFNNLLCLDICTHKHAYLLDSNLNLSCDYEMFHYRKGVINNTGLQVIFKDLYDMMLEIELNNNYENNDDMNINPTNDLTTTTTSQFFL